MMFSKTMATMMGLIVSVRCFKTIPLVAHRLTTASASTSTSWLIRNQLQEQWGSIRSSTNVVVPRHNVKRSASSIQQEDGSSGGNTKPPTKRVANKNIMKKNHNKNLLGKPATSVPTNVKGVFCGSGSDAMFDPRICETILDLVDEDKAIDDIQVVYLGTATYDIVQFRHRQTQRFVDMGCQVKHLKVVDEIPTNMHDVIDDADILIVGGGNTFFALERWQRLGLIPTIRRAMDRGCVITGGSAGAICWFDGGHSNAADPDTYKKFRMDKFGHDSSINVVDEIYATSDDEIKDWEYIRVSALGFLPGLVTPHHDRTQSNGVLRAYDFDQFILNHPGERGIGIDHFAALVVDGPNYRVVSLEDKEGTLDVQTGEFVDDGSGIPAVWIKEVVNGKVVAEACPSEGKLTDLLRVSTSVNEDIESARRLRKENPDDGPKLLKQ